MDEVMHNGSNAKKAKKLVLIWVIVFIFINICMSYFNAKYQLKNPIGLSVMAIYAIFISCPLLLRARNYAKLAGMRKTVLFSGVMLLQHSVWLILGMLELLDLFSE